MQIDGVGNSEKGFGPTQAKLRELRLKEEKKKAAVNAEQQQQQQQRLTGSMELSNESHPKVCNIFIGFISK